MSDQQTTERNATTAFLCVAALVGSAWSCAPGPWYVAGYGAHKTRLATIAAEFEIAAGQKNLDAMIAIHGRYVDEMRCYWDGKCSNDH